MNTFTPTALETGVSPAPRGDRPGRSGEDFAEAFYGAVDGLPQTPASEPPSVQGLEPSEAPRRAAEDQGDLSAMAPVRVEDPRSLGLSGKRGSPNTSGLSEEVEGRAPPVLLDPRDARVANSSAPTRTQDFGKALTHTPGDETEGSASAKAISAKASAEAPGASRKPGSLPEGVEGRAPSALVDPRDARVANSSAASLEAPGASRKPGSLPEARKDARPAALGGKKPHASWQGASASVPDAASQKESGVAKADLRNMVPRGIHEVDFMEKFTPPGLGKALPQGATWGKAAANSRAPLEMAGQGFTRLSLEVLEPRLASPQLPSELGAPGPSAPDSGQPTATPFIPGLEGRGTAAVATIQEARFGPALVKDLQQQFASLQEGDARTVELRLDPPELGRVTVRISIVGDEARVVFAAAQGGARELLETTLPRLREMFEEAGLTLGEAEVDSGKGDRSPQRQATRLLSEEIDANDLEAPSLLDRKEAGVNSSAQGRLDLHA